MRLRPALLVLLLAGCAEQVRPDGGAPDAGPADAGSGGALTGSLRTRFVLNDGGLLQQPADLRGSTLTVYLERDGGFEVRTASGAADGTFAVPDVSGRFLLELGDLLVSSTAPTLALGENVPGRPDVFVANPNEGLRLTASNLAPWTRDDELQLSSWGAGLAYFSSAVSSRILRENVPDAGATSLDGLWVDLEGENVVEASKGDDLTLLQLSAHRLDGGGTWKVASRATSLQLDLALGGLTSVQATLVTLPQQPLVVRYDARSFEGPAAEVHPEAVAFESRWLLDAHLGAFGPDTITTGAPDLSVVRLPADAGVVSLVLSYGNPFPPTWTPFVTVGAAFDVLYRAPLPDGGQSLPRSEVGSISQLATLEAAQAGTLVAPLSPLREVTLDGVAVADGYPMVERTPVLSWVLPARGTVARVDVERIGLRAETITRRVQGPTLRVVGPVTSLRLPPGFLVPGGTQYLRLTAVMQPNSWDPTAPQREAGPPAAAATTMTRAFTVRPLP